MNAFTDISFQKKARFIAPIYIENLAFFCMPFLDLAFLDIHSREIILIYGMMLPWIFISEISINSVVIAVSGEEISRRAEKGQFFKRRIQLATMIVILVTGTITILAAMVTTNFIASGQFWSLFPYFVLFTFGFGIYAQRKIAAIEATSLGKPNVALAGSVLGVAVNLVLNLLAQQILEPTSLAYAIAIALSTIIAYIASWIYIMRAIGSDRSSYTDNFSKFSNLFRSIVRPLKTQATSSLELISSQSYSLIIIALLISVNSDFVYVRSFLVQFFLIVTATGIAVSIYCNNTISELMVAGKWAILGEIQQNKVDILRVSIVQSLFVVVCVYALFKLEVFGRDLSYTGIQSLVIGVLIYVIYEPIKATNIMLLTVIRRLHIVFVPTVISLASNIVAACGAFVATWFIGDGILVFATLMCIVFIEELFRFLIYDWFIKFKVNQEFTYV